MYTHTPTPLWQGISLWLVHPQLFPQGVGTSAVTRDTQRGARARSLERPQWDSVVYICRVHWLLFN